MLVIKTVKSTKNALNGLLGRLDVVEERLSELKDKVIETSRTEIQIKKRMKNISYRSLFTV